MSGVILGVNSAYHEPSACLMVDGELVAFAEEERFNRIRHGKRSRVDNADELPEAAMAFCLRQAGLDWAQVDAIGYAFDPDARLNAHLALPAPADETDGGWGTQAGERAFHASNLRAREALLGRAPTASFHFLPHHLCHAGSAFLVSPYEEAAILVVDGIGEVDSTWMGLGTGERLEALETVAYPHSIGFVWEKMSELLGLDAYIGPGKVMGYAATTDPHGELSGHDHLAALQEIFRPVPGGTFFVDEAAFRFRTGDFGGLERRFGPRRTAIVDRYEDASIAAALQEMTNEVMVHLADRLYERVNAGRSTPIRNLCLAGGVALNCVANTVLATRTRFESVWIQPAANDAGSAVGAAAILHLERGGRRTARMDHAFYGPGFSDDALREALHRHSLAYTTPDSLTGAVAARIERGELVAWFQGRQECGPRALGHRSILTDPTRFDSRTRINTRVKYRESFRPFAPSALPEAMDRYFEVPGDLPAARFMLFALPLKDRRTAQLLPAVVQENGSTGRATSRVQVVDRETDPLYAELIDEVARRVGVPAVLNTSFNIQEPIVTSPDEAIATFVRSAMDALVLGPYVVDHPGEG